MMFIEVTITEAVVGGVVTLLGGGIGVALLNWLLNYKSTKVELIPREGTGLDEMMRRIKALMADKLTDFSRIQDLSTKIEGQKVLIEVRDAELIRQGDMLKEILIEQGRAEEREKQCQVKLSQVMEKLDEYGDLHQVNRRLVQDNLRMRGELDEHTKESIVLPT